MVTTQREDAGVARFYRIVLTDPPTEADFLSHAVLGRPIPVNATPEVARSWSAVSVFDTAERARQIARLASRRGRELGGYLALLEIAEGGPVHSEKTGGPGHYDLRASAADLLACVVAVLPL